MTKKLILQMKNEVGGKKFTASLRKSFHNALQGVDFALHEGENLTITNEEKRWLLSDRM
jgi:hypothetical protein